MDIGVVMDSLLFLCAPLVRMFPRNKVTYTQLEQLLNKTTQKTRTPQEGGRARKDKE
jgi:hypothetical protein